MAVKLESSQDVGARLRALREDQGIPRERLALALKMGAENVRHYESGKTPLTLPMLPVIADLYGMTVTELVSYLFDGRAISNTGDQSATKSDDRISANYNYTDYGKRVSAGLLTTEWDMGRGLVLKHIAKARPLSQLVAQVG